MKMISFKVINSNKTVINILNCLTKIFSKAHTFYGEKQKKSNTKNLFFPKENIFQDDPEITNKSAALVEDHSRK